MFRVFSSMIFSFFLLFQSTSIAEEGTTPQEAGSIEQKSQKGPQAKTGNDIEPSETLSEAQKEARAAEEAELRESGVYEETVV